MESKLHQLITRYYAGKRYRSINILLCLVSLAVIYRLGYVVGKFIYYVELDFFS